MNDRIKHLLLSIVFILSGFHPVLAGFTLKEIELPPQFKGSVIRMAAYDNAGLIWFVTNGGLYRYDGNQAIGYNLETTPSVNYASIQCILADNKNNIWLGSKNGLVKFDLKNWTTTQILLYNFHAVCCFRASSLRSR